MVKNNKELGVEYEIRSFGLIFWFKPLQNAYYSNGINRNREIASIFQKQSTSINSFYVDELYSLKLSGHSEKLKFKSTFLKDFSKIKLESVSGN